MAADFRAQIGKVHVWNGNRTHNNNNKTKRLYSLGGWCGVFKMGGVSVYLLLLSPLSVLALLIFSLFPSLCLSILLILCLSLSPICLFLILFLLSFCVYLLLPLLSLFLSLTMFFALLYVSLSHNDFLAIPFFSFSVSVSQSLSVQQFANHSQDDKPSHTADKKNQHRNHLDPATKPIKPANSA